jgi:hypothetical protein
MRQLADTDTDTDTNTNSNRYADADADTHPDSASNAGGAEQPDGECGFSQSNKFELV